MGGVHFFFATYMQYPFRLFLLLSCSPEDLASIAKMLHDDPSCLWDPFAAGFFGAFPTAEALQDPVALAILGVLALILRLDTVRIECLHAAVRRMLGCKSVTWAPVLANLSADFISLICRRLQGGTLIADEVEDSEDEDSRLAKPYAPVGGGPQRAFAHQWCDMCVLHFLESARNLW